MLLGNEEDADRWTQNLENCRMEINFNILKDEI